MAIGDIFKKIMGSSRNSDGEVRRGLSPDEVELRSFQEEERRDGIKKLLEKFREKKSKEMIMGNTLVNQGKGSVMGAPSMMVNKNIFGGSNTLNAKIKTRKEKKNLFF